MELNQMELQDIRHLAGHSCGFSEKVTYYKSIVQDQNILDIMDRITNSCDSLKQELIGYVGGNTNE